MGRRSNDRYSRLNEACDKCDRWYHPACLGIEETDEVKLANLAIVCQECLTGIAYPAPKRPESDGELGKREPRELGFGEKGAEGSSDEEEGDGDDLDDEQGNGGDSDREEIIAGECRDEDSEEVVNAANGTHRFRVNGCCSEEHTESIDGQLSKKTAQMLFKANLGGLEGREDGSSEMVDTQSYQAK